MSLRGRPRLIVATDRAPLAFRRGADGMRSARGGGGVVTALLGLAREAPLTWVAAASGRADALAASALRDRGGTLGSGRWAVRLVPMSAELFADYRGAFADRVLWFAQHGLWGRRVGAESPERIRRLWSRYAMAARAFADAIATELLRPGQSPIVLVHDYQLYAVPEILRARVPGARIAHFTHIPWPPLGVWRAAVPDDVLTRLLRGLLAADVLHFQTRASVEAFQSSVDGLLPDATVSGERITYAGRRTVVRARPVSVDATTLRPDAAELAHLRADPRPLVVRVDRADPIKNVPAGFLAFEQVLEARPRWVGRVRSRARITPTRVNLPEYARELDTIRTIARRINDRFGRGTIELIERHDRPRALAELAAADVVLVNSIADGMNLVAKEAAVLNESGALVLSRRAGAYAELGHGAIGIDPGDVRATAAALVQALEMPSDERRRRAALMHASIASWTSRDWVDGVLGDLEESAVGPVAVAS